tara:strand:- start:863 stop:1762 length:900 start_codon:yes stop_codon:yes gene_type:complete
MDRYFFEIFNLYKNNIMPNKILFSGKKGIGKSTLSYHLINYILSVDEEYSYDQKEFKINEKNKSYKLIQNNTHPNFYLIDLIDEKKSIDVAQVREMIAYTNKSSFNDMPRFILIDNIENLNNNSINALLKIIEEPNKNIFFLLIHNNEKKILPTLKSRCLTFKINFSFNENILISNKLIKGNVFEQINYDLISYYNTPGEIINLINFANEKKIDLKVYLLRDLLRLIIDKAYYKKNKPIKEMITNFIELYFLKEYKLNNKKNSLLNIYHYFINKIYNAEKFNLDEESLFLEFRSKLLNE